MKSEQMSTRALIKKAPPDGRGFERFSDLKRSLALLNRFFVGGDVYRCGRGG